MRELLKKLSHSLSDSKMATDCVAEFDAGKDAVPVKQNPLPKARI